MANETSTIPSNPNPDLADRAPSGEIGDELASLASVAAELERLDRPARDRVLAYLVARYQPRGLAAAPIAMAGASNRQALAAVGVTEAEAASDIRSFREFKGPTSGHEMAAVLAFYLAEVVPEEERRETINPADVDKYFKQAGFPLPARSRNVLFNAKTAGYLEEAPGKGEYKLSPVGYNLVKHRLPRNAESTAPAKTVRRRTRRAQSLVPAQPDNAEANGPS
jgi:hypothetical protein